MNHFYHSSEREWINLIPKTSCGPQVWWTLLLCGYCAVGEVFPGVHSIDCGRSLTNQWRITALHHRHKVTAQGRLSNFVSERKGPCVPEFIVNFRTLQQCGFLHFSEILDTSCGTNKLINIHPINIYHKTIKGVPKPVRPFLFIYKADSER